MFLGGGLTGKSLCNYLEGSVVFFFKLIMMRISLFIVEYVFLVGFVVFLVSFFVVVLD